MAALDSSATVLHAAAPPAPAAPHHLVQKVQLLEKQLAVSNDLAKTYKAMAIQQGQDVSRVQPQPQQQPSAQLRGPRGVAKKTGSKLPKCYNCGRTNHMEPECTAPCKLCGSRQHVRFGCPRKGQPNPKGRSHLVLGSDPGFNDPSAHGHMVSGTGRIPPPAPPPYPPPGELAMPSPFLYPMGDGGEAGPSHRGESCGAAGPSYHGTPLAVPNASAHVLATLPGRSTLSTAWILDSGATHHMTPWAELLFDYRPATGGQVSTAAHTVVPRAGVGSLRYQTQIQGRTVTRTICDVWHVPELSHSLLSAQQLKRQGCWLVSGRHGDPTEYVFDNSNELVLEAPLVDGLCRPSFSVCLNPRPYQATMPAETPVAPNHPAPRSSRGAETGTAVYADPNHVAAQETPDLWHRRLGHISYEALAKMAQDQLVTGMNVTASEFRQYAKTHTCEVCVQAKHRAAPFRSRVERSTVPGQCLHSDVCGPYETESLGGGRYTHTMYDEASSFIAVSITKDKDSVPARIKFLIGEWEQMTKTKVQRVYSDRGGEYIDSDLAQYFLSKGITHVFSAPHTPQQNGKAERVNQTLNDTVRAMLIEVNLPKMFWAHAMVYAVQIRNAAYKYRLGMSPHQAFCGYVPTVRNFRTFGCKVYARVPDSQRKKLDPKSELGVYLGPETRGPGCKVLVHRPNHKYAKYSVAIRRDVVTFEAPTVRAPLVVPTDNDASIVLPEVAAPGLDDQIHQYTLMDAAVPNAPTTQRPYSLRSQAPASPDQPVLAHGAVQPTPIPDPQPPIERGVSGLQLLQPASAQPIPVPIVRHVPDGHAESAVGGGRDIPNGPM